MFAPKENTCPMLKGPCIEAKCKWWVHIRGKHPQSGAELDFPDCAVKWLPVLLIENAQEMRQTAAAVESARNEQVKSAALLTGALMGMGERVIELPRNSQ